MPYVTYAERFGREEGKKEGLVEGKKEGLVAGRQEALEAMLEVRFPVEAPALKLLVRQVDDLDRLAALVSAAKKASLDELRAAIEAAK